MGCTLRSLLRWWGLDSRQRTAALAGLWRIGAITWQLRTGGFGETQVRLDSVTASDAPRAAVSTAPLAHLVDRVAEGVTWRTTCLHRAFALTWMLRERGVPADVRIGVSKEPPDEALLFHAWVEVEGQVVNDSTDVADRFAPFPGVVPPPDAAFT